MCSECETVDKEHAYEYLKWLLLEYGTVNGKYAFLEYVDNATRCSITYNYSKDYIFVSGMNNLDTETIEDDGYIAVYLNDFQYESAYGDDFCVAYGYLDPKTFNDNSPIQCSDYVGPDNYESWFMEKTRLSVVWIVAFLDDYLKQCIPEITIEDLGLISFNS